MQANPVQTAKRDYPLLNDEIKVLFGSYPAKVRERLLRIRRMIFEVAEENADIGEIVETVKWNVPSYLTENPKSGISIRLDPCLNKTGIVGLYGHCQSSFIPQCRVIFGDTFEYDGKRGILLDQNKPLPEGHLRRAIYLALTYNVRK